MQNVAVIGGGTGSYVVLSGLVHHASQLNLSAIVTVADSGGSAKTERDEFGILPVSDARKALLALTEDNTRRQNILRRLFTYRFDRGGSGLQGGTFGNLFLLALTEILGSESAAIAEAEKILQTKGEVIPVALASSNLILEYEKGQVIVGEHYLDSFPGDGTQRVQKCYLLPPVKANKAAISTLKKADLIILPPGDFFASLVSNLCVKGVKAAIKKSRAKTCYILNLMTKYGQTYRWKASDHIRELEKYLGRPLDYILINTQKIPPPILKKYQSERDQPVADDLGSDPRVIRANLLSTKTVQRQKGDQIKRSLARHDPNKIARKIREFI